MRELRASILPLSVACWPARLSASHHHGGTGDSGGVLSKSEHVIGCTRSLAGLERRLPRVLLF